MADRYTKTERLGVNAVEGIFLDKLGWIFREQPIIDMGIDAHVETVIDGTPKGKLFGVQIKTGESHFNIEDNSLVYYGDNVHLDYWLNHSLPVLLIAHLPETKKTYWQVITETTVKKTKKAWRVDIPKNQELNENSKEALLNLLKASPEQEKLNRLFFDRALIRHLANRQKINIYTEEWHNKSLGRGPFTIILIDNGIETVVRKWFTFYNGKLEDVLTLSFPWADIENDDEYYTSNFDESVYEIYNPDYLHTFKIHPYKVMSGEVGAYRINLKLNKIGKSFLTILDYIEN